MESPEHNEGGYLPSRNRAAAASGRAGEREGAPEGGGDAAGAVVSGETGFVRRLAPSVCRVWMMEPLKRLPGGVRVKGWGLGG